MTTDEVPIRVLIVDDHAMVRKGLAVFLLASSRLELVGEASNGQQAVELCARMRPDVVLMDVVMPDVDGITATRTIREKYPETQVIALSSFSKEALVQRAYQAGAIAYLPKDVSAKELTDAILLASAGVSPQTSTLSPQAAMLELTERELEILALIVEGVTNREMASRLNISYSTVKTHIQNIFSKLQVTNRTEAAIFAVQNRLFTS